MKTNLKPYTMKNTLQIFKLIFTLLVINVTANAQYEKLLDFNGTINGGKPFGDLYSDGTYLYGITEKGGANNSGVIFKIKPDGTGYVKLNDFPTENLNTTDFYAGALITDGTYLYGTKPHGGTNNVGFIFKIKPDGTGYSVVLNFTNSYGPYGSLYFDGTYLYGTTRSATGGYGSIYKIKPDGTGFTTIFLCPIPNPNTTPSIVFPMGGLISDGTYLYGMSYYGGSSAIPNLGAVYKIMPDGSGFTILHSFQGGNDGGKPYGSLIYDGTFLYGMTYGYGTQGGTVFKIKPDGTGYQVVLGFYGPTGGVPYGNLMYDGTYLYGMTSSGGPGPGWGRGVIFKIKPDGTSYRRLMTFVGTFNGSAPYGSTPHGSLITDGTYLYGMTNLGGATGNGTIFKFNLQHTITTTNQSPFICSGQYFTVAGSNPIVAYNTSGIYTDTIFSFQGYDSIVITNLTVTTINTSVSVSGIMLTSGASTGSYQWVDCNNNYSIISGETNQSFTATTNGNYAVIVTGNGCTDTSSCYAITSVGLQEAQQLNNVLLFPNPIKNSVSIDLFKKYNNTKVTITSVTGQIISTNTYSDVRLINIPVNAEAGFYFINILTDYDHSKTFKIIKND